MSETITLQSGVELTYNDEQIIAVSEGIQVTLRPAEAAIEVAGYDHEGEFYKLTDLDGIIDIALTEAEADYLSRDVEFADQPEPLDTMELRERYED